jgi:hypothetical protein
LEKCFCKRRWEARKEAENAGGDLVEMSDEEKREMEKLADEMEAKTRLVFDILTETFNYGAQKVTDGKANTRVVLPKALSAKEEAEFEVRRAEWGRIFDDTDEKGLQESNLSVGEERGMKSLKKRVANGEIVVCQTDKSGRFALMTMADYVYAGSKHVQTGQTWRGQETSSRAPWLE